MTYQKKTLSSCEIVLFCIQDPDIEGLIAEIIKHGGKQHMSIREYDPNDNRTRCVM